MNLNHHLVSIHDLPVIGNYVFSCYMRDRMDFVQFSPEFWGDHLPKFSESLNHVSLLVKRNHIYQQLKETNMRIETIAPVIDEYLNQLTSIFAAVKLKVLIKRTKPLFESLHEACLLKNPSKMVEGLTQLKLSVFPYITQLEKSGFDHDLQAQLDAYISIVNAEATEIKSLLTEQAVWEENCKPAFNNLRQTIELVLKAGRRIYRKNPTKQQEYSGDYIKTKILQEAPQTI